MCFRYFFSSFEVVPVDLVFQLVGIFFLQGFFPNYLYIFLALNRSTLFGFCNFLRSFVFLIFVAFLVFANLLELRSLLYGASLSYFLLLVFLFGYFQLAHSHRFSKDKRLYSSLLKGGTEYYFIGICSQLNLNTSLLLATQISNPAGIAAFSVAKSFSELVYARLTSALNTTLDSTVARSTTKTFDNARLSFNVFSATAVFLLILYLLIFLFAEPLITFLYGNKFQQSGQVSQILLIGHVLFFSVLILIQYFQGINKIKALKYIYFAAGLSQGLLGIYILDSGTLIELAVIVVFSMGLFFVITCLYFLLKQSTTLSARSRNQDGKSNT